MKETYLPKGVCPRKIEFDLEDGIVHDLHFTGGCDGNLKAIGKLVEGMPADRVIAILEGNTCGRKPTSCADQLARALRQAQKQS